MLDVDPALLDMVYRGVTESAALSDALQSMMQIFGCSSAALVSVEPLTPDSTLALTAGVLHENTKLYHQFSRIDPAPVMFSRLPVGTASATNRIFTADELREIVFFQEFLRPISLVE